MSIHKPTVEGSIGSLPCPGPQGSLTAWLDYLYYLHAQKIDLGLSRMQTMVSRLGIDFSEQTVITVGGTNGKGSTVTMLESIYRAAGYSTALHTSPHLLDFRERCRLDGELVDEASLIQAFCEVEKARGDMTLSFFEYTLLAFFLIFKARRSEVIILEVGLGGRLDATNVIDSNAAVVVTVGIDHVGFLGDTREAIGAEKAPIYRQGCPAICVDPEPPQSLLAYVKKIGAQGIFFDKDFHASIHLDGTWDWVGPVRGYENLPPPALGGRNQYQNASGVIATIEALQSRCAVGPMAIVEGLKSARLTGRFEPREYHGAQWIIDVGHNPHAAQVLEGNLKALSDEGYALLALCGMLKDKDRQGVMNILGERFSHWVLVDLPTDRGGKASELYEYGLEAGIAPHQMTCKASMNEALQEALAWKASREGKQVKIVIFGSFVTVEEALKAMEKDPDPIR